MEKEKIRLFEMFAGFGGASFALKKAGIPFDCVGFSEIDKYAIECYTNNHYEILDEDRDEYGHSDVIVNPQNFGDATQIKPEEIPDFDLLTGGFPCQAFSIAGKGLGELDTRGTLFNDIIRIAEIKKPKYMLLENVKGLTNKNHKQTFNKILSELKRIGYVVWWNILNSKDFGIPQNRERVWFVCVRKDLFDWNKFYSFPEKEELKIFLKDILEENVDEKYYLKQVQIDRLIKNPKVSYCLDAHYYKGTSLKGYLEKKRRQLVFISSVQKNNSVRIDGLSNCLPSAMGLGGGHTPMILDLYNHKVKDDGVSICLTEPHHNNLRLIENLRIRKLTPKECFRLMGFLDDNINLDGLSDTQKYKLAGNGWDINIVSKLLKRLLNLHNRKNVKNLH